MTRLQKRGPGWGWLTLRGPSGAGVSRLLQEAVNLAGVEGAPPPLVVRPVRDSRLPLEPLRRALLTVLPHEDPLRSQRAIAAVLPARSDEVRALAAWLGGAGTVGASRGLDPTLVARLLGRLCTSGPLIVDDVEHLDAGVLAVLRTGLTQGRPDVIAGTTAPEWTDTDGPIWELEPLGETQIELLLRRWLRHPATARRLSSVMVERCKGRPGRVVCAVRRLGRLGYLVKERRGVVFGQVPEQWPDGLRRAEDFRDHVNAEGALARRVVEVAAMQGVPDDVPLLAAAAGAKEPYVQALLEEAVAARGGMEPGCFFPSRAARRAYRKRMPQVRRLAALDRLAARSVPPAQIHTHADATRALMHLRLLARRGEACDAAALMTRLLDERNPQRGLQPWACNTLAEVAHTLADQEGPRHADAIARAGHALWDTGRRSQARTLFTRPALGEAEIGSAVLLARARDLDASAALALLERELPALPVAKNAADFDTWALLAAHRLEAGEPQGARQAWRRAYALMPTDDLGRRAHWHRGLAACARTRQVPALVGAHLRRAIRLQLTMDAPAVVAPLLLSLGETEILADRPTQALAPLRRAAHIHRMLDQKRQEARVRYRAGRVLLELDAFDSAVGELKTALRTAGAEADSGLLTGVHLALAAAYHGCGDIDAQRHHGQEAAKRADSKTARMRAAAVVARADLAAGVRGAHRALTRCERDLRRAGCAEEADAARAALFDASLKSSEPERAEDLMPIGAARAMQAYAAARLDLTEGRHDQACAAFRTLGTNSSLPADLRAACYAHLADGLHTTGRHSAARKAAVAAAALLEVRKRSRADDVRLHDVLARVFGGVGEYGRAEGHRSAARRGLRTHIDSRGGRRAG